MDAEKTIKELSTNEKKVLLTLHKLKDKASPDEILKNGDFTKEVEIYLELMNNYEKIKNSYHNISNCMYPGIFSGTEREHLQDRKDTKPY